LLVCGVLEAKKWELVTSEAEELKAMLPSEEEMKTIYELDKPEHSVIEEFESEGETWTPSS
jgi:hypothetical protein